ncbi:hypothetical protein Pmani_018416 [Petrolisthes manimaculis]|uniref:Uncharacterized protein n=1 Tax=Petrolisthes manimaculis TaxID=1843537 RepID=A0AAE1U4J7_9EUCA|nr:hypothetical protein Pmani_018416 [Petrolisthes manimaculis]
MIPTSFHQHHGHSSFPALSFPLYPISARQYLPPGLSSGTNFASVMAGTPARTRRYATSSKDQAKTTDGRTSD